MIWITNKKLIILSPLSSLILGPALCCHYRFAWSLPIQSTGVCVHMCLCVMCFYIPLGPVDRSQLPHYVSFWGFELFKQNKDTYIPWFMDRCRGIVKANVKLLQLLIITKIIYKINITGHRPKKSGTNNQTMNQISSLIITHWKQGIEKGFSLNPALCFHLHHSTHVQRNHKYNRV